MMIMNIEVTKEEYELIDSYAKFHGCSVTDAFKRALFEKIEDEIDKAESDIGYREFLKNPVTYSMEEMKRELFDEI